MRDEHARPLTEGSHDVEQTEAGALGQGRGGGRSLGGGGGGGRWRGRARSGRGICGRGSCRVGDAAAVVPWTVGLDRSVALPNSHQ